jgi:hypothetical protein
MKTILQILKWAATAFFAMAALTLFKESPVSSVASLLLTLFIMPPTHNLLMKKIGRPIHRGLKYTFVFLMFIVVVNGVPEGEARPAEPEKVLTLAETRMEKWKKDTSPYGENYSVFFYLKENLNDPDSYKHVNTEIAYQDENSYCLVKTTYRAKNGFGAMVLNTRIFKVDFDGTVTPLNL